MNAKSIAISELLIRFADSIRNLSDDEINKILVGTHSLEIKITKNRMGIKGEVQPEVVDVVSAAQKLSEFSDRAAAGDYLRELAKNKRKLELIARHLDVAVSRQDKSEDIVDKIVESTVGARLRSAAIRGSEV
ncbi:hypothetical protein QU481_15285 [Crenobacter sp. SG2303]|uniref:Uncharacterized protein n=1 Tax=Crenobacter oryzisoli TaxID=3056844 RepID=A0ABT7XR33_9NEIS|nr:hypothetical protein [Crenobacter sp. SG2303]MDN0076249.1 hypothetical protein [Crenobacter sp. SG2303]